MLDDEEEPKAAAGDLQDDEYARFVWRKERLEKEGDLVGSRTSGQHRLQRQALHCRPPSGG